MGDRYYHDKNGNYTGYSSDSPHGYSRYSGGDCSYSGPSGFGCKVVGALIVILFTALFGGIAYFCFSRVGVPGVPFGVWVVGVFFSILAIKMLWMLRDIKNL